LRLFIAVPVPPSIQGSIQSQLSPLLPDIQASGAQVNWVPPENFHLTLKFLGECPESQLPDLKAALEKCLANGKGFSILMEGFGVFPKKGAPKVVWAGVTQGWEKLAALAEAVRVQFELLGFPLEERPFSAHLTLGRMKEIPLSCRLKPLLARTEKPPHFGRMTVHEVHVMQSALSANGPTYTRLHSAHFRA